jgi:hypothetical protein
MKEALTNLEWQRTKAGNRIAHTPCNTYAVKLIQTAPGYWAFRIIILKADIPGAQEYGTLAPAYGIEAAQRRALAAVERHQRTGRFDQPQEDAGKRNGENILTYKP